MFKEWPREQTGQHAADSMKTSWPCDPSFLAPLSRVLVRCGDFCGDFRGAIGCRILNGRSCRICLLEGSSEDDPLIRPGGWPWMATTDRWTDRSYGSYGEIGLLRPCQCKGSIEYVHLGCLRHWVGHQACSTCAEGCVNRETSWKGSEHTWE